MLSLGSILTSKKIIRLAIEAVTGKPVTLLVSAGPHHSRSGKEDTPNNVFIDGWLPLAQLLPRVSVMISHGGVATIHECIDSQVPLLIYSLNVMDMNGNAARVHGKGLGIAGGANDSAAEMWDHIELLLTDPSFKENCGKMAAQFRRYGTEEHIGAALSACIAGGRQAT
jgi:UDP:flavonoid glycosyltransferase YjiC (YdhE family)